MTTDGGDRALGAPRFDVVLRGYDRRQVDEHVARLQRVIARLQADLEAARSRQPPPPLPMPPRGPAPGQQPLGGPSRPTPRPRPAPPSRPGPAPDVVGGFTDRMQSILQAAEEEAAAIRRQARSAARPDDDLRAQVADLVGERAAVLSELASMRALLEGIMSGRPGGSAPPAQDADPPPPAAAGPAADEADATTPPAGSERVPPAEHRDPSGSLRPRDEPEPEPSDLFRPTPSDPAPAQGGESGEESPTVKVGAVRPAGSDAADDGEDADRVPANGTSRSTSVSRSG